jgi:ABC-type nickel/cobalt efflux system permease component RcnA
MFALTEAIVTLCFTDGVSRQTASTHHSTTLYLFLYGLILIKAVMCYVCFRR